MKLISRFGPAIAGALLAAVYWPTFIWMIARFEEADTYYSHGYLVPFVFAYLLWIKRGEFKKCDIRPLSIGLVLLLPALLVHLTAYFFEINFISGFSIILALFGLCLYLYGTGVTKKAAFAIIFLVFMIPLPQVFIINMSFNMKMMAANAATYMIKLMGVPAVREGSIVYLKPGTFLTVGDPCSGLRSLIALTALGALYAYLVKVSVTRKILLFLLSIPIALGANILRIILLLLVAYAYNAQVATGKFVHDFLAFLLYVFAIIGLIFAGRMLSWAKKR
jgi:exosortase